MVAIVGLFIFGLILGGLSIYLGYRAVREIDASGGRLTGRRRAVAAQIIGAIAFVLWAIGIVLNVAAGS